MNVNKINVLVVTYNQENVIGRCLESILCQKVFGLNKIIICDDHSTDNNWLIINAYKEKYPDIIEIYRNEFNKGIYGNLQQAIILRGEADFYIEVAGDDILCDGWFECVQRYISINRIDSKTPCLILSDWESIDPEGKTFLYSQEVVVENEDLFSLKTRGLVYNRSSLKSKALLNNYTNIDLSKGVCWAEAQFDYFPFIFAEKCYYCRYVGSRYYKGIGISTKMQSIQYLKQQRESYELCLNKYEYSKRDRHLIFYFINVLDYKITKSYKFLISACYNLFLSGEMCVIFKRRVLG